MTTSRTKLPPERRYRIVRQRRPLYDGRPDAAPYAVIDLERRARDVSVWCRVNYGFEHPVVTLRTQREVDRLRERTGRTQIYSDFVQTIEVALRLLKRRKRLSATTIEHIRMRAHMEILGDTIDSP